MDENRLENTDNRPKRRRDKYNPYKLYTIGINTDTPHYFVAFTDSQKVHQCLEINKDLFELFNGFELEDLSFLNEFDNHYEHSELTEASMNKRAFEPLETMDEVLLRQMEQETVHKALKMLPEIQRRRVAFYYFEGLNHKQIAELEGCSRQAVRESIASALKKMKKFLE